MRVGPDFSARDLEQGVPVQQLFIASLIVPDLLLRAHAHDPDPAFVAAASRYMSGFVAHEASLRFPAAFERNSHAVANRASVLVRLWLHIRNATGPGDVAGRETARRVHLHARRLAAYLSLPGHFIAGTNHGVMQNVALLQLATAFPGLPDAEALRSLALTRLARQLPGYIAPDGAVLEHSAGYHFHGVVQSGYVVRLLRAAGHPVPPDWQSAHDRALSILAALQRPDRSMPFYGNTYRYAWTLPHILGVDAAAWERQLRDRGAFTRVLPYSGNAIWWEPNSAAGTATHTLVPWGYFAGHGHRRAQELSLLVWGAGTDWVTNTGYWPGSDPEGVALSNGWRGGNAPHVVGEAPDSPRRTRLLAYTPDQAEKTRPGAAGAASSLRFVDLERAGFRGIPAEPRVRRQIVHWRGSTWLVLDSYSDPMQRPLSVIWTSAPEMTRNQLSENRFMLQRPGTPVAMELSILGGGAVTASSLTASREPFGGWVAFDRRAHAAPSVEARLATPEGWMLTVLNLTDSAPPDSLHTTMLRFGGPEDWEVRIMSRADAHVMTLKRLPDALLVHARGKVDRVELHGSPRVEQTLAEIATNRGKLLAEYPRFRTLEYERRRYSIALTAACLLVLQAASLLGRRSRRPQASGSSITDATLWQEGKK